MRALLLATFGSFCLLGSAACGQSSSERTTATADAFPDGPALLLPPIEKGLPDGGRADEGVAGDGPALVESPARLDAFRDGAGSYVDIARTETPVADRFFQAAEVDMFCTGWSTLERLKPAAAAKLIEEKHPLVINVHIPYEGNIPGTDANIPYDDVDAIETYLKHDKCAEVLIYCRSGNMSLEAARELLRRGYLRLYEMEGGFRAWEAAGYPFTVLPPTPGAG